MAWTKYQIFLVVLMVTTGSINTLGTKWSDLIDSMGVDGEKRKFNHPFFQANAMFFGMMGCFIAFKILYSIYSRRGDGSEDVNELTKGKRDFNPLILFLPAMCDMTATSLMYIGLNLTYASSFQMLRGSVIVFVGLLSMVFLKRVLEFVEWAGIFFVIVGLSIVGLADFISKESDKGNSHEQSEIIIGDLFIVVAQIVQSIQMVYEEKHVMGTGIPPLQAVGWEGIYGFLGLGLLHIPFYFIRADPPVTQSLNDRLEDAIDAFVQIGNSWQLQLAMAATIISIAFYNFAGISITKELSATTRMVLDSFRTIVIWIFSLALFGQVFHWLQKGGYVRRVHFKYMTSVYLLLYYLNLIGFLLLLLGMCLYNHIIFPPPKSSLEE